MMIKTTPFWRFLTFAALLWWAMLTVVVCLLGLAGEVPLNFIVPMILLGPVFFICFWKAVTTS